MIQFWKEHVALRVILIAVCFLGGLGLIVGGWKMTKSLVGLGIMVIGLILLLVALAIYNKPYEDPPKKKSR